MALKYPRLDNPDNTALPYYNSEKICYKDHFAPAVEIRLIQIILTVRSKMRNKLRLCCVLTANRATSQEFPRISYCVYNLLTNELLFFCLIGRFNYSC